MDKKAIRTVDGARDIIEYNVNVLYHLPKKYRYLDRALKDVRLELLRILNFCKNNEPLLWKQKYVWFLDTNRMRKVGGKSLNRITNQHFNYLCCVGALNKLRQTENYMTGVNMTFLLNERKNGKIRPINTFTVYRYTVAKLEQMEERAKRLLENNITPGNISNDKLKVNDCSSMAKEVYYANSENSIDKKVANYKKLTEKVEELCNLNGYTTKEELCNCLRWGRKKLDSIIAIFSSSWKEKYKYKAPNKAEKEKYNLETSKWIIVRR